MSKNRFVYFFLFVVISLLLPKNIYADCTNEEKNNFKKIESEYTITYEYDKESNSYTIVLKNPQPDTYGYKIAQNATGKYFDLTTSNETPIVLSEYAPGNYTIEIYGKTETCKDKLKTSSIDLPRYNKYSEDPLCDGIEEFYLCQETYDKNIDYETFVERVNIYKNNQKPQEEEKEKEEKKENISKEINKILEFIEENLVTIIIVVVFVILIIITIILTAKSIRKSRRLEWWRKQKY